MTVHTACGKHKTTKLECISRRAIHRKDTVFNNIGYVLDLELLRESYQELDGKKAIGIDGVTKETYGKKLEDNLQDLLERIRRCAYKPQASRIIEIPKEDGSTRPLAISCFEDKIVQMAVSKILTAIYEPQFLPCSYGYREGMNGHEALRALMKHSNQFTSGATLEIDLRKYFNTIPHDKLQGILSEKISDKRFLKVVEKLIRAPVLTNEKAELNRLGCPQGSIVSPILSNIYLHHVVDSWFSETSRSYLKGKAEMVRFADDMVFLFQRSEDAEKFYKVLPKRLERYGLKLHEDKSSLLKSGSKEAEAAEERGERLPAYKFFRIYMLLGKESKRLVATKIHKPSRSIHGKTQRPASVSKEKSKSRNENNHSTCEADCYRMGKLSCHIRQSTTSKLVYSNEQTSALWLDKSKGWKT